LIVKIKNNGDKEAKNIELKSIANFWEAKNGKLLTQPEKVQKISGDLSPKEEMEILIPINNNDTAYPYNHIHVVLNYQDSLPWRWRKHQRSSTWFFNVVNGTRVSDEMNRIDKVDYIPADLWPVG
jgi:hypothetical protein